MDWKWFGGNRSVSMFEMCKSRKVLKTQPSPISLRLKFYVASDHKEVFGCVTSRDVDMSALSRLWVLSYSYHVWRCCVWVREKSECSDGCLV